MDWNSFMGEEIGDYELDEFIKSIRETTQDFLVDKDLVKRKHRIDCLLEELRKMISCYIDSGIFQNMWEEDHWTDEGG